MSKFVPRSVILIGIILGNTKTGFTEEPPALNPFGKNAIEREDALPGYIELSDGSIHPGQIYLTRDKRLIISDEQSQRQREIPLIAVKQIDCIIKKEWLEKEWKFKELAKDEKIFTGRSYPVREYDHIITLQDGRRITGGLSAVVYIKTSETKTDKFILNKRNKGEIGADLQSLVYPKLIKLGKESFEEGLKKAAERGKRATK
jgi:hypothetical protein